MAWWQLLMHQEAWSVRGTQKSQLYLWCLLHFHHRSHRSSSSKQGRPALLFLCLLHQWLSHHSLNKYSVIRVVHFNNTKRLQGKSHKYLLTFQDLNTFATPYPDSYPPWQLSFPSKMRASVLEPSQTALCIAANRRLTPCLQLRWRQSQCYRRWCIIGITGGSSCSWGDWVLSIMLWFHFLLCLMEYSRGGFINRLLLNQIWRHWKVAFQ